MSSNEKNIKKGKFYARKNKPSTQTISKPGTFGSYDPTKDKLVRGRSMNDIEPELRSYLQRLYPSVYQEVFDDAFYADRQEFDEPNLEDYCADVDNPTKGEELKFSMAHKTIVSKNEKIDSQNQRNMEERVKIAGTLLSMCDRELRRTVTAGNKDIDSERDLYKLQCAIRLAMEFRPENSNVHQVKEEIDIMWRELKQLRDETNHDYKIRVENLAEKQNQAFHDNEGSHGELTLSSDARQARHYIQNLHRGRYATYIDQIETNDKLGTKSAYPSNLQEAYELSMKWPARRVETEQKDGASYIFANIDGKNIKMQKGKGGKYVEAKTKDKPVKVAKLPEPVKKDRKIICGVCSEEHTYANCPIIIAAKKEHTAEQIKAAKQEAAGKRAVTMATILSEIQKDNNKSDDGDDEYSNYHAVQNVPDLVPDDKEYDYNHDIVFAAMNLCQPVNHAKRNETSCATFKYLLAQSADVRNEAIASNSLAKIFQKETIIGLDTLTTTAIIKSAILIKSGSIRDVESIKVHGALSSADSNKKAQFIFGKMKCIFDEKSKLNLLCQYDVQINFPFDVVYEKHPYESRDIIAGFTVYFLPDIPTEFRYFGKLLLGDVADVIAVREYVMASQHDKDDLKEVKKVLLSKPTTLRDNSQLISVQTLKKAKESLAATDRMAISPKAFSEMIKGGYIKNTNLSVNDVLRGEQLRDLMDCLKSGDFQKAMMKLKKKKSMKLTDSLVAGEVSAVADLLFFDVLAYFAVVTTPGRHLFIEPLGHRDTDQCKTEEVIKPAITKYFNLMKTLGLKVKTFGCDLEGAILKNQHILENYGVKYIPFDKGYHDGNFNQIAKHFKEFVRYFRQKWPYPLFSKILNGQVLCAARLINMSPTSGNINNAPADYVLRGGVPVDYKKTFSTIGCMDLAEVNNEELINRNSIINDRSITAVALYPTSNGSWRFLNIITGKEITRSHFVRINYADKHKEQILRLGLEEADKIREFKAAKDLANTEKAVVKALKIEAKARLAAEKDEKRNARETARMQKFYATPRPANKRKKYVLRNPTDRKIDDELRPSAVNVGKRSLKEDFNFATQMTFKAGYEKHQDIAEIAMIKELRGIEERDTWIPVLQRNLSNDQKLKIIQGIALIAEKYKISADNMELILKGRLCADGRREDISMFLEGELAAPTVQILALFSMISVAAAKNHCIMTFDIGQAFLNAKIENEVYVRLEKKLADLLIQIKPEYAKFRTQNGSLILKLLKALYGTREAAKLWYDHFKDILVSYGYRISEMDKCVFFKTKEEGNISTIMIHVDDGIVTASDESELFDLSKRLDESFEGRFTFTLGKIHQYLGMLITQKSGYVIMTMEKYTKDLIDEFEVTGERRVPADLDLFSIDVTLDVLPEEVRKKFHTGVYKLLFLSSRVRPDCLCSTIFLCRRVKKATAQDWTKLINVLKYLNKTITLGLCLGGDENGIIHLGVYADAAHGVNPKATSQTGIFTTLGRGSCFSKSQEQKHIARSSMEAEAYALSDAIPPAIWIQDFIKEAGYGDEVFPGDLYEDNMSLIHAIRKGDTTSDKTRHIRIRKLFTRQFVESGRFNLSHCPTADMIADILTKPLQGELFEKLRDLILGYTLP